jgi:hypothetical protein
MNVQTTQYHIARDTGLDLRALLTTARMTHTPVEIERETVMGGPVVEAIAVLGVGADLVKVQTARGVVTEIDLWRITTAEAVEQEDWAA